MHILDQNVSTRSEHVRLQQYYRYDSFTLRYASAYLQHSCHKCQHVSQAHRRVKKYCWKYIQTTVCIYTSMNIGMGSPGTAPFRKERPNQANLPQGKKGGQQPVTGVYLNTWCGGSHLPVPASRHTVMQSMSAKTRNSTMCLPKPFLLKRAP